MLRRSILLSVLMGPSASLAADAPIPKGMKLDFGNEHVRVWRLTKQPRLPSPSHYTPPAVLVFLNGGRMRWTFPDGAAEEQDFGAGSTKWWPGGIHVSENVGSSPMELLVIVPVSALPK